MEDERGIPKRRWNDDIRKYMKEKQVKIEEAQERRTRGLKTRCDAPKYGKGRRINYIIVLIQNMNQPPVRFELTTPGLRDQCSTTEL